MLTLIKILAIIGAILVLAGFITSTFGLFKSFARDRFNRFIYLGLAAISSGALVFGVAFGVGYLQLRSALNSFGEGTSSSQDTSAYEDEEYVEEGDDDLESTNSLGFVDPTALTEESAAMTNGNYFPECIESENAGDFFYDVSGLDGVTPAYLVPISPDEVYVVSDTNQGPAILYVNSADYALAGANDVATDYLYLSAPEELGFDPIDTSSEAYIAAEGCVS